MSMKFLIFLCSLGVSFQVNNQVENPDSPAEVPININESTSEHFLNVKQKCIEEVNVSSDGLEQLSYTSNFEVVQLNSEYANYTNCCWREKKLLQLNGEIDFKELEKIVNYAVKIASDASDVPLLNTWLITSEIMEHCKNVNGTTHGEKAVEMRNCFYGKLLQQRNAQIAEHEFEDIPNLDLTEEDCVNELKLDGPTTEDINRHYVIPENLTDFGDFLACYWKKIDLMDVDGNFNVSTLVKKFDETVEFEILARSRVVYLSDIITESILNGCRKITTTNQEELALKIQNYILKRLPYFKVLIQ